VNTSSRAQYNAAQVQNIRRTHFPPRFEHGTTAIGGVSTSELSHWTDETVTDRHSTLCLNKVPTSKLCVTLSDRNRFSKFVLCWKAHELCYKIHMKLPTSGM